MTDEEMAREYANENKQVYGSDEYADITDYINIKDAFLAGLNAGRPQWHKVTDDLPDDERYVWTNKGPAYYDYDCQCWRDEFGRLNRVIAWCEPKYEE